MEKDGLIAFVREEEKRKLYSITELGRQILELKSSGLSAFTAIVREEV